MDNFTMDSFLSNLPKNYLYRGKSFEGTEDSHKVSFYASLKDLDDIKTWIERFSNATRTNWSVFKTNSRLVKMIRRDYVCHMNHRRQVFNPKVKSVSRYKDTGCPARITIKIKEVNVRTRSRYHWVKDGMPASIELNFEHNHPLLSADVLSFRRLSSTIKEKFFRYFDLGMTASTAAPFHIKLLDLDPDIGDCATARLDAAIVPNIATVNHLFSTWRNKNTDKQFSNMWSVLERKVEEYRATGVKIMAQREPFCIALLTPMMQRAHELTSAAEVAFIESTTSFNSEDRIVTFMFVSSPYGAVPAGIVLTPTRSEADYTTGFFALDGLLEGKGFGGQGHPTVFITDDSVAEQSGIEVVWPASTQRLSQSHILQDVWRWLNTAEHSISQNDQHSLLQAFRRVLFAPDEASAIECYVLLQNLALEYYNFQKYVESLWERRDSWCMACSSIADMCVHHTDSFTELTVRLYKDSILARCKAYNTVVLLDLVINAQEEFYKSRIEHFVNGRVNVHELYLEKLMQSCSCSDDTIKRVVNDIEDTVIYHVPNETTEGLYYEVDADSGLCNCPGGLTGQCCKHLIAVYKYFPESLPNPPTSSAEAQYSAAYVSIGAQRPSQPAELPDFYVDVKPCIDDLDENTFDGYYQNSLTSEMITAEAIKALSEEFAAADQCMADVLQKWDEISTRIKELLEQHVTRNNARDFRAALAIFNDRLANIHTASQMSAFLVGDAVKRRYHAGSGNRIKPSSAKKVRRGRPSNLSKPPVAKKQKSLPCILPKTDSTNENNSHLRYILPKTDSINDNNSH